VERGTEVNDHLETGRPDKQNQHWGKDGGEEKSGKKNEKGVVKGQRGIRTRKRGKGKGAGKEEMKGKKYK